jgi:hypothetical protein
LLLLHASYCLSWFCWVRCMAIHVKALQRLDCLVDGGYGTWRHSNCCAIDTLTGALKAFPDSENAVNDDGINAFVPLDLWAR